MTPLLASEKTYPLGPTGSFIGATITALLCVYCISLIFKPAKRGCWGEDGCVPMSALSTAAWAIYMAVWSVCLFLNAIDPQSIKHHTLGILGTATAIIFLACLRDWINYRPPNKSAIKSFRVYLNDPGDVEPQERDSATPPDPNER